MKREQKMEITSIRISTCDRPENRVLATADVILNHSLSLRGIKILRGRYGLFLAFPGLGAASPHRAFETLSMRFRKELQSEILATFRNQSATPLSLFG